MGLSKRLTEMQIKFAHELVNNEGRMNGKEAAVAAGYSQDRASVTASELTINLFMTCLKNLPCISIPFIAWGPVSIGNEV